VVKNCGHTCARKLCDYLSQKIVAVTVIENRGHTWCRKLWAYTVENCGLSLQWKLGAHLWRNPDGVAGDSGPPDHQVGECRNPQDAPDEGDGEKFASCPDIETVMGLLLNKNVPILLHVYLPI
jgi:hypothetical protein